jgi:hypothetical protein
VFLKVITSLLINKPGVLSQHSASSGCRYSFQIRRVAADILNKQARTVNEWSFLSLEYKYYVSGHHPSSCFYLKTKRFGNWILSSSLEIGTSSIDWTQLIKFSLKLKTKSSLRNVVILTKNRTMDDDQKHNTCINVPSSQTFRPYLA